jgi:ribosomal protein S18 acetylase RimI-like enzyme
MIIRKAKSEDADDIGHVLSNSYNITSVHEGKKIYLDETKKGVNYIVAEHEGRIVGLTTWLTHGLPKHGLVELDRIAVLEKFRGKGVAKELFNKIVTHSNNELIESGDRLRKLFLLTHSDNKRAQAFYAKMGLKKESVLKSHFYDEKDEIVMSKFF